MSDFGRVFLESWKQHEFFNFKLHFFLIFNLDNCNIILQCLPRTAKPRVGMAIVSCVKRTVNEQLFQFIWTVIQRSVKRRLRCVSSTWYPAYGIKLLMRINTHVSKSETYVFNDTLTSCRNALLRMTKWLLSLLWLLKCAK